MATQTRFDLNAALETWRNELAAQSPLTPGDRRELERHLSDSIADLLQRGLNEEEAFWLARRRLGQPQQLADEFVKANAGEMWRERILFWMLFGNFSVFVWAFLTDGAAFRFYSGSVLPWFDTLVGLLSAILPPAIGVLIVKGKLCRQVSAVAWFLTDRKRFAVTAVALSGIATAIMTQTTVADARAWDLPGNVSFASSWLPSWFVSIISVAVIIYFMPRQTRKNFEHA